MHTPDDGRESAGARERPRRGERDRNERRDTDRRRESAERRRPVEAEDTHNDRDLDRPTAGYEDEETPQPTSARLPALKAAQAGLQQLAMVTGREPQGVVSLVPEDDGWRVGIEIVEDRRIPSSTDVIGLYEAMVDHDGELTGYSRRRRYSRGKGDVGE